MSGRYPTLKFTVFAVICLLFAVWLVTMIGNLRLFEGAHAFEAVFDDATGLLVNDEVRIAGVPVGRVSKVEVERGRAVARFTVRDDIELGSETTVGIRWRGVVGLRYLYVYPDGDEPLEPGHRFATERTFAPASIAVALERITPVMRALEPEVQNIFLEAMEEALVGRELEVQELIAEAGDLLQVLAARDDQIGRVLENAAVFTTELAQQDDAIRSMLTSFADSAELIAERNDQLEALIIQLGDAQIELRRMLDQNEDEIRGVLAELENITDILAVNRDLLEDVLRFSGHGIVSYHLISRWGQFFNVRFVGISVGELGEITDGRGGTLPPRREHIPTHEASGASWSALFGGPALPAGGVP